MFTHKVQEGENLTSIAKKYGFRNYQEAGIKSVASGNFDLIHPDEVITLDNYDPNKVKTSGDGTPPVISSLDNSQQFNENKSSLQNLLAGDKQETGSDTPPEVKDKTATTGTGDTTDVNADVIDDPLYTKSRADDKLKIDTATATMESDKDDYLSSITTRLADIDAVTKATTDRITLSFEKRIKEQTRINTINTDRIKAYGVAGGAVYQPIQFSDAVSERERESADNISALERERDALITEAETASMAGKSDILAEKLKGVKEIEDKLKTSLADIEAESEKQYTLLRTLRKEKEDERVAKVKEIQDKLKAYVAINREDYQNMTPEEMEAEITQVMKLSNLSYSEAYNAIMEGVQTILKDTKTQAEIDKLNAQTETEKERAKTEQTKQAKNLKDGNDEDFDSVKNMSSDIPDSFADQADAEKQRIEFIKKYGKTGEAHWKSIFLDPETGDTFNYPLDSGLSKIKSLSNADLFNKQEAPENASKQTDLAKQAKVGSTVIIFGKKYKKIGEDNYELIE